MFAQTLLPDTLRAINKIGKVPTFQKAYLAGGTALALQLGHRISVDLDFFTHEPFDERLVSQELGSVQEFSLEQLAPATVLGKIGETRLSLFFYKYGLLEDPQKFEGIKLAGKKDIAAMKINALESRGTKRDFIDIYFLSREFTVESMINFYDQKYKCLEEHLYSIVKSLNYFADAEDDPIPQMLTEVSWEKVKRFFENTALEITKSKITIYRRIRLPPLISNSFTN